MYLYYNKIQKYVPKWKKYDKEGILILTIQYKRGVEYKVDRYKIKPAFETQ